MENMMKNNLGANDRMHDEWLLPNGLRVVGERLPYLRSVSIGAWMHVGSMMEEKAESGLSHFLEHMVFKGTEKRTARQIAEEMDAVGGQLNAFTGRDCTCFYAKVIDENLELAVDILADLEISSRMTPRSFSSSVSSMVALMTRSARMSTASSRFSSITLA